MKRRFLFLFVLLSPQVAIANPAIYAPQICSMMRSGLSYQKAYGYVEEGRKQQIINTYPLIEGLAQYSREFNNQVAKDIYIVTKSQCPDAF